MLRFDHMCYGQFATMVNLSPRVPIKKYPFATTESNFQKHNIEMNIGMTGKSIVVPQVASATETPDFEIIDEDYLL